MVAQHVWRNKSGRAAISLWQQADPAVGWGRENPSAGLFAAVATGAVTDFAADVSFTQAMDKLVEHYGVLLGESTIRRITEGHALKMFETHRPKEAWPEQPGCEVVVAEMDGGMVPLMEPDPAGKDRRKGKRLYWKEAKICLTHAQGSQTLAYGGTLQGDAQTAGRQLFDCARRAGFGKKTRVHAVGDGAEWIAAQVEERFGVQGNYLVDFYHVCDYLDAAAKAIHANHEAAVDWLSAQKECLKSGRIEEVIEALNAHLWKLPKFTTPKRRCAGVIAIYVKGCRNSTIRTPSRATCRSVPEKSKALIATLCSSA